MKGLSRACGGWPSLFYYDFWFYNKFIFFGIIMKIIYTLEFDRASSVVKNLYPSPLFKPGSLALKQPQYHNFLIKSILGQINIYDSSASQVEKTTAQNTTIRIYWDSQGFEYNLPLEDSFYGIFATTTMWVSSIESLVADLELGTITEAQYEKGVNDILNFLGITHKEPFQLLKTPEGKNFIVSLTSFTSEKDFQNWLASTFPDNYKGFYQNSTTSFYVLEQNLTESDIVLGQAVGPKNLIKNAPEEEGVPLK